MAAKKAQSGTLSANAVTTVKFPQYFAVVHVVNRSTNQTIWTRSDGTDPTVAGDDCYPVLAQQDISFTNGLLSQEPVVRIQSGTQINLICSASCDYTVWAT